MKQVPVNDLGRLSSRQRYRYIKAITRVLKSGWYILGPETEKFEHLLAAYTSSSFAIGVANGSDALRIGLSALDVTYDDYVVTVANAGFYSSAAILSLGATPLYCDIDSNTLLMSTESLKECLDKAPVKPKVVIVTNLFGALAPVTGIVEICRRYGVSVLVDNAQGLGSKIEVGMAGGPADITTTSFYPTKNLGALGDGGAILTSNENLANRIKSIRQYGWVRKYEVGLPGGQNSRLDEIQAAILSIRLGSLGLETERRRNIHKLYEQRSTRRFAMLNKVSEKFNAHLAVSIVENRQSARRHFEGLGIKTDIHYPIPDHRQPLFADTEVSEVELPVTEWAQHKILTIPCFPRLLPSEVKRITNAIEDLV